MARIRLRKALSILLLASPILHSPSPAIATAPAGSFYYNVGTGTVQWGNQSGFGDFNISDGAIVLPDGSTPKTDAYDTGWRIQLCSTSSCAFNASFTEYNASGTPDNTNRLYQGAQQTINGLNVTASYKFSNSLAAARILVKLDNTSGSTVTRTVKLLSNLGSDSTTYLKYQSTTGASLLNHYGPSGSYNTNAFWLVTSDQSSTSSSAAGVNDPIISHVLGTSGRDLTPTTYFSNDEIHSMIDATVPANSTRYIMFVVGFAGINTTANSMGDAYNGVNTYFRNFSDLPSDIVNDLSSTQRGQILNWLIAPSVTSFAPSSTLTNQTSITYDLEFSESSSVLTSSDFSKTGTGASSCVIGTPSRPTSTYSYYQVQLSGCSSGTVVLTLDSNTVTGGSGQTGPSTRISAATVTIDTATPTIQSVTAPSSSTYSPNTNINFTVNFSESVTVSTASGRPRLAITVGSTQRYADFSSLTDSRTATFRYTVQSSALDIDRNGIDISTTLDLNNGTISDLAGNALSPLTFAAPTLTGVKVAQLPGAPTITSIDPSNQTLTINFTPPSDSGSDISNYQYSTNGGSSFSPFSPADTTTPLVLSGLSNGTSYNVGIRGLTTLNGSETFGATSNFIRETPTVVTISAPSFTVARGTLPGSFKLNFSPVTGATSYTVKVYKSNDSFASPFVTITNYTSGTDIQDGNPRTCGNSSTPICYGVAVGHTFKFTITPVAGAGYTSAGEGEKSEKYGMFYPYGASFAASTDGVVGLDVIDLYSNKNLGKSGIIAYIYSSADNYASIYETASIVGTSWNRIALPSGDSYSVTLRHLGATVGDTIWLDSDESTKPSGMFVWNKPNAPSSITAERNGSGSIRISWTRASGPYQTYYYATSTNGSVWTSRGNTTSDSATISSLTNGTPIYVRVHVFGSGTYQRASDYTVMSGTITPAGPPGPVATGSSSPGDASIVLGWTAPSNNGGASITGYLIEYSPNTATYTESITALSTDTRLTLSGLVNGTTYFVRIKAVNAVGPGDAVEFAGGSAILVKGTAGSTVGAVTSITRTTATISATINARGNTTTPTLTWGLVGGSQTDVTLASVSSDNVVVTSNLTGLLPGRRYQVTSEVDPGISQDLGGRPVYFTTTPDSVTGVAYTTTTSSVTVSWNYDSGGNGYGFSYGATASLNGSPVGSGCTNITAASGGRSSCQFTGLTANTAYTFSVTKSITGGDYGNGTSEAYTLIASTDPNIATISLSINGGNTNLQFGSTINIVATTNVAGKVTFRVNGRAIKSCSRKNTSSLQVTCAWKPSIRGTAQISAVFDPTSNLYTNVTSNPTSILVGRRSSARG